MKIRAKIDLCYCLQLGVNEIIREKYVVITTDLLDIWVHQVQSMQAQDNSTQLWFISTSAVYKVYSALGNL